MNGLSSDWAEISQGSILGLLLFNIFLNDILLLSSFISNIYFRNYADDNTLKATEKILDKLKSTPRFCKNNFEKPT